MARLIGVSVRRGRPRCRRARTPDRRAARGATTSATPTARATTCCTAWTSTSPAASGSRSSDRRARASRPSVGCSPASTRRGPASVEVGGVRAGGPRPRRPARARRARHPGEPRLHRHARGQPAPRHARARRDDELRAALGAVDALEWADALPDGLDTELGTTGHQLSPSQAQQLALARLVLVDPHTLVLDEATSLLDPRAARHLERSLSAVLSGDGRGHRAPTPHRPRRGPRRGRRRRPDHRARHP